MSGPSGTRISSRFVRSRGARPEGDPSERVPEPAATTKRWGVPRRPGTPAVTSCLEPTTTNRHRWFDVSVLPSLLPQSRQGIDTGSPPGGDEAGRERYRRQDRGDPD